MLPSGFCERGKQTKWGRVHEGGDLPLNIGSAAFVISAKARIQDDWFQGDAVTHP